MAQKAVMKIVRKYAELVCDRFPVSRIVLFGSFARGRAHPDSDIDIAVVLKNEPDSILDTEAELYRIGAQVDARIEPVVVDTKKDLSGFWEEISRYGKVVYRTA